jgi:hopanoid biosynthesis associated radical SAM protein HpnH
MPVPLSQMWAVASHVLRHEMRGVRRYPLVLMLEPLLKCNLACAGCGKIQHPKEVLRRQLTPEECFAAVDECSVPVVSIPGGEPLLHPQIDEIVQGLVARRKYVYLCTNAIKLEASLARFRPTKYLTFSVHLDGPRDIHDRAVCRQGVYETAVRALRAAVTAGFRVTTNTTVYDWSAPDRLQEFFDEMMRLGVEGMMISPGYPYEKAPDQEHFLSRERTAAVFRQALAGMKRRGWRFNQTPLYLQFLQGNWDLECTPWGNPTYNVFGWQRPCYLLDEGYCDSFAELMATTRWSEYGRASGNPKCGDCMVHSGYEPSAVAATFGSWRGFLATAKLWLLGRLPGGRSQPLPADDPTPDPQPPSANEAEEKDETELPILS